MNNLYAIVLIIVCSILFYEEFVIKPEEDLGFAKAKIEKQKEELVVKNITNDRREFEVKQEIIKLKTKPKEVQSYEVNLSIGKHSIDFK